MNVSGSRSQPSARGGRIEGHDQTSRPYDMPNTRHRGSSEEGGLLLAVATRGWTLMDNKTVLAASD